MRREIYSEEGKEEDGEGSTKLLRSGIGEREREEGEIWLEGAWVVEGVRLGDREIESHVALGRRALPTILRMEQRLYFCLVLNAYKYSYHFELRPTPIYASRRAGFERSPWKQMHI